MLVSLAVTGSNLLTSLWLNAAIGLFFFTVFVVCRRKFQVYRTRVFASGVLRRPPELPLDGFNRVWYGVGVGFPVQPNFKERTPLLFTRTAAAISKP